MLGRMRTNGVEASLSSARSYFVHVRFLRLRCLGMITYGILLLVIVTLFSWLFDRLLCGCLWCIPFYSPFEEGMRM